MRFALSTSVTTEEDKNAIIEYAVSKGFSRPSEFIRVCIVSYIKQRPPKKGSELSEKLNKYLE